MRRVAQQKTPIQQIITLYARGNPRENKPGLMRKQSRPADFLLSGERLQISKGRLRFGWELA